MSGLPHLATSEQSANEFPGAVPLTLGSARRAGRDLPEYQLDRLKRLAGFMAELAETRAAQFRAAEKRGAELYQGNRWLEGEVGRISQERELRLRGLETNLSDNRRTLETLRARLKDLENELAQKNDETERIRETLSRTEQSLAEKSAEAERIWRAQAAADVRVGELNAELAGIYNSTGWRVLQMLYRVRFFVFPRGSWRERAAKSSMHAQRRLRNWAAGTLDRMPRAAAGKAAHSPGAVLAGAHSGAPGLVSVILPVYNQADLLRESIESVLAQTYDNFELVIVNDGSTDGVEQVMAAYAGHPKVRMMTQTNQKLPKALSNGFEFARGEFWTWTSADNLMEPRQLECQVEFLRAHPEADMVYCDYLAIDDSGAPLRDRSFRPQNRRRPDDAEIHVPRDTGRLNTVQDNFIGACFMYRAACGRALGEYAPNLGVEDYDYWMRMNSLFAIRHLGTDEVLYRYRVHANTLNARAAEHRILERVTRLMTYDRERRAFYSRPFVIHVDAAARAALNGAAVAPHELREWPAKEERIVHEKGVWLLSASSLPALAGQAPLANRPTVVCFDADAALPYRWGHLVQRLDAACLASDERTCARLEMFTSRVWQATSGPARLAATLSFANNAAHYRTTTPADLRRRLLPHVLRPTERPLRVLLQVEHFEQGGLEQVVLDLAAGLGAAGFETALLVLGREGGAAVQARQRGLRVLHLPPQQREYAYRQLLGEWDVVNAHYSLFGAGLAREAGRPFVQTVHNTYVWLDERTREAHRGADWATTAYACVSSATACYADGGLGLSPQRMLVIPNGVNTEALDAARATVDRASDRQALGLAKDDFVFLNVASIYPPKAQHLLVAALQRVRQRNSRVKVAVLGRAMDAAYAERVREQAERLGVADAILWLGHRPDPQRFYVLSDAFVLPSFVEGWSLALAEALYARLPIVATDVGAAHELVDRERGYLVPSQYGSILNLDGAQAYAAVLEKDQTDFVELLAQAMLNAADSAPPPELTPELSRRLDRRQAYQGYARLFEWLAAGGQAAAARPWIWELQSNFGL